MWQNSQQSLNNLLHPEHAQTHFESLSYKSLKYEANLQAIYKISYPPAPDPLCNAWIGFCNAVKELDSNMNIYV